MKKIMFVSVVIEKKRKHDYKIFNVTMQSSMLFLLLWITIINCSHYTLASSSTSSSSSIVKNCFDHDISSHHHHNRRRRRHDYFDYKMNHNNPIMFIIPNNKETNSQCQLSSKMNMMISKNRIHVLHGSSNDNVNPNDNVEHLSDNKNNDILLRGCPPPTRLRQLLYNAHQDDNNDILLLPCCYDGITARLIGRSQKFHATFMTGFGVSAIHGYPDTQLISYHEMLLATHTISETLSNVALETNTFPLPCIADGDTGYGNAMNVKRTVFGYARSGMAGIMIEDQVSPKRCGHVIGKSVISFEESIQKIKAAVDARNEYEQLYGIGTGPLIVARTDSLKIYGFHHAIERCLAYHDIGADITFLEAPESIEQMKDYCTLVPGYKLANMLEYGTTPILTPKQLKEIGYTMAAYPLTLLSSSIKIIQESLYRIEHGISTDDIIIPFTDTKDIVGFTQYAKNEDKYKI